MNETRPKAVAKRPSTKTRPTSELITSDGACLPPGFGEAPEDVTAITAALEGHLQPVTPWEKHLAEEVAGLARSIRELRRNRDRILSAAAYKIALAEICYRDWINTIRDSFGRPRHLAQAWCFGTEEDREAATIAFEKLGIRAEQVLACATAECVAELRMIDTQIDGLERQRRRQIDDIQEIQASRARADVPEAEEVAP